MEALEINEALLKPYFTGRKKHAGYDETVKLYDDLRVHADGGYPRKLIETARPFESDRIKDYREAIYQSVTKDPIQRVLASLTKIRRSMDWSVDHPTENYPNRIPENERLATYADKRLPVFESMENWLFRIALKNDLLDPNAICYIGVQNMAAGKQEFLKPFPIIYNSPRIIEYKAGELLIVRTDKDDKTAENVQLGVIGTEFLVVTTETSQVWKLKGDNFALVFEYKHGLGMLPAFKLGGIYYKSISDYMIDESRLNPMVPRLNDAAREYSDLQAEVVQHIHSEKWVWAADKCPMCRDKGGIPTGFINDVKKGGKITCPTCKGNQTVPSSPYLNMVVRGANDGLNESQAPIPPAGYITKDIAIVKIQDERVDKHLFKALAAVNMQFLDQTPLNQSGKAKEVDRDEVNNFVYSVAEDLVRIADRTYLIIGEYRHKTVVPSIDKRAELLPEIKVPEKYDLLSSNYLTAEIKEVKDAGVSPVIIGALESEFAAKKFYADAGVREMVTATLELDPLAGVSEENKMIRYSTGGITRLDYVISSNITPLVRKAMEDKKFVTLTREEKVDILKELARELIKEMDSLKVEVQPTKPNE